MNNSNSQINLKSKAIWLLIVVLAFLIPLIGPLLCFLVSKYSRINKLISFLTFTACITIIAQILAILSLYIHFYLVTYLGKCDLGYYYYKNIFIILPIMCICLGLINLSKYQNNVTLTTGLLWLILHLLIIQYIPNSDYMFICKTERKCMLWLRLLSKYQWEYVGKHNHFGSFEDLKLMGYLPEYTNQKYMIDSYSIVIYTTEIRYQEQSKGKANVGTFTIIAIPIMYKSYLRTFAITDDDSIFLWEENTNKVKINN